MDNLSLIPFPKALKIANNSNKSYILRKIKIKTLLLNTQYIELYFPGKITSITRSVMSKLNVAYVARQLPTDPATQ